MSSTSSAPSGRGFSFPRSMRLQKASEFDRAFREGVHAGGRWLVVNVFPNGLAHSRLGMAVNRSTGKAVLRNRIRRRFREAFRLRCGEFPENCDVVVIPRRPWRHPSFDRISDELLRLVTQALRRRKKR